MNSNKKNILVIFIIILIVLFFVITFKYIFIKNRNLFDHNNKYQKKYHSYKPLIYTIDNFLTDDECNDIIKLSKKDKFRRGYVLDSDSENSLSELRTNSLIWIDHNKTKNVKRIIDKISYLVSLPSENAEDLQLIRYNKSEHYSHHYDAFEKTSKLSNNQRLVTALVYLTDVKKGGETDFSKIGIRIKPKKGKLIVFYNCLKDGKTPNPDSLHAGLPVIEGTKYAFNLWFHEKCYRKL